MPYLVWDEELFVDATKVEVDAAVDYLAPRWFVEAYLREFFEEDGTGHAKRSAEDPSDTHDVQRLEEERPVHFLSTAANEVLLRSNSANEDRISRSGAQDRAFKGTAPRERTAGTRVSRTDPDATPMRLPENARRLGYRTNYVVDGGKARVILSVLVTPGEVSENRPMLDLLWRTAFRSSPRTTRRTKFFNTLARPTASVSSGSLGRARFLVLSRCSERLCGPFVSR
jgi:hypothetical protein